MSPNIPPAQIRTEDDLLGHYGDAVVAQIGGQDLTLRDYVAFAEECPVDDERMEDPQIRMKYLAGRLASNGLLQPEHSYLLGDTPGNNE